MKARISRPLFACIAVVTLTGNTGCGFSRPTAVYSYKRGVELVNETATGILAHLDPRPVTPSPVPEGYVGGCENINGNSDGLTQVIHTYDLSARTAGTSAVWLDQTRQHLTANGYTIEAFDKPPLDRRLVANKPDTHLRVAMWPRPNQAIVSLSIQSGCVPETGPHQ